MLIAAAKETRGKNAAAVAAVNVGINQARYARNYVVDINHITLLSAASTRLVNVNLE